MSAHCPPGHLSQHVLCPFSLRGGGNSTEPILGDDVSAAPTETMTIINSFVEFCCRRGEEMAKQLEGEMDPREFLCISRKKKKRHNV